MTKDNKTKAITTRAVPGKGVEGNAVETEKKMTEPLGRRKIIKRSDSEPAILGLKEAVRRKSEVETVLEEAAVGDRQANELVETPSRVHRASFA